MISDPIVFVLKVIQRLNLSRNDIKLKVNVFAQRTLLNPPGETLSHSYVSFRRSFCGMEGGSSQSIFSNIL